MEKSNAHKFHLQEGVFHQNSALQPCPLGQGSLGTLVSFQRGSFQWGGPTVTHGSSYFDIILNLKVHPPLATHDLGEREWPCFVSLADDYLIIPGIQFQYLFFYSQTIPYKFEVPHLSSSQDARL